MRDLALHLLDLVENSLEAGAGFIDILLEEEPPHGRLVMAVADDGRGMAPDLAARALDPFVTSRAGGRVGLGLSLLAAGMRRWGGGLTLESGPGQGCRVRGWCRWDHPDRPSLGPWCLSFWDIILAHPRVDFRYLHRLGQDSLEVDTRLLRARLGAEALQDPALAAGLGRKTQAALAAMGAGRAPVIAGDQATR